MDIRNVVVTGGAGFIGSHLCERLIKDGHRVICIDNLQGGVESNIHHLFAHPHFEFLHLDITQPIDFAQIPELKRFSLQGQGIQDIYHLACPTSPKEFLHIRKETLWTNALGTLNILEMAKLYNARFLLASSSVVYGKLPAPTSVVNEQMSGSVDVLGVRACYEEGKRFAEASVATYQQLYRLDAKIARIFRSYGPRMPINQGHMVPDFMINALSNLPLIIYGDEQLHTSLLFIDDLIDGLIKLINAPLGLAPVNLGGEQSYTLKEIASQVVTLTRSASLIEFHPPLESMSHPFLPDITRAKQELGWLPLTPLEQGLQRSIEYTLAEKGTLH